MKVNTGNAESYTPDEVLENFVSHLITLGKRCNLSLISENPETGTYKTWFGAINNFINEFHEMTFGHHDEFPAYVYMESWPSVIYGEEIEFEPDCLPVIQVEDVEKYISHFATLDMDEEDGEEYFGLLWYISLGQIAERVNALNTRDAHKTFLFIWEMLNLFENGDDNFDSISLITTSIQENVDKSIQLYGKYYADSIFLIAQHVAMPTQNSIEVFERLMSES